MHFPRRVASDYAGNDRLAPLIHHLPPPQAVLPTLDRPLSAPTSSTARRHGSRTGQADARDGGRLPGPRRSRPARATLSFEADYARPRAADEPAIVEAI